VGIETGIHYPIPLHLARPYQWFGHRPGDYPFAERAAAEVLSLPLYPELSAEQQELVAARLVDRCDGSPALTDIELTKRTA